MRNRAQTPKRGEVTDASFDSDTDSKSSADTGAREGRRGTTCSDESDGATEMALISASFKRSTTTGLIASSATAQIPTEETEELETSEITSQDVTLSEIRDQTRTEQTHEEPRHKEAKGTKRMPQGGVPMREELFKKIGWTRSSISGPAVPVHNPLMVCWKRNSTKGTLEILRHHRSEKHLRREQKWCYEHLTSVDLVTEKVQHRVRGRDGKIVNKVKLADKLPKFIHAEVVEIWGKTSFYEDFTEGHTTALVTPESLAKTQLCIIADFIEDQGNLLLLRIL